MKLVLATAIFGLMGLSRALPQGFTTFFHDSCPQGWIEVPAAQGRLVVSVGNASSVGFTVNAPLQDREVRQHEHTMNVSVTLPEKHIAAADGPDHQGAEHGEYFWNGTSQQSDSGLAFVQLPLCLLEAEDDSLSLTAGTVGYFGPGSYSCPEEWEVFDEGIGRTLVPSYDTDVTPSSSAPLQNQEDRVHVHTAVTECDVSVPDCSYIGVDGPANENPAPSGEYNFTGGALEASSNLPYIQLLTCAPRSAAGNMSMPSGALIFAPDAAVGCPAGWELFNDFAGRYLVSRPSGAAVATFGGTPISKDSPYANQHSHEFGGVIQIGDDGIALGSGCCASGYAQYGGFPFAGCATSDPIDQGTVEFPYLMAPLCIQQGSRQNLLRH